MARLSLPTPTLLTARLRLRPFIGADADALCALHSSAYVLRYWERSALDRTRAGVRARSRSLDMSPAGRAPDLL
jgi:RimJ/RimL family protein N-acetyltransferase